MPKFRRNFALRVLSIVSALAIAVAQPAPDERRQIFSKIESSLQALKDVTGFQAKKKIAYDLISREKVNEFLKKQIKESIKPDDIRAEEITLKKFGFAPEDFNLEKSTVDLMTEQAAAFYDYNKKKLFLTDWAPSAMEQPALVHELAHALADQNFNLEKFIKGGGKSDDSALARMAVMEGQATWLMTEVEARNVGQTLLSSPAILEAMTGMAETTSSQFPVFNSVPLYLRETLVFPYSYGARFQDALVRKLDKAAYSQVFRKPPISTQQILHPEKYFDRVEPTLPPYPSVYLGKGYKPLAEGMLGELDHGILLRQYATREDAAAIAPHWKGGRYFVQENRKDSRVVLQYVSEWDSPDIARELFRLYKTVLRKKWKSIQVAGETESSFSGTGDDGYFVVTLSGVLVSSVEGLASPEQAKPRTVR